MAQGATLAEKVDAALVAALKSGWLDPATARKAASAVPATRLAALEGGFITAFDLVEWDDLATLREARKRGLLRRTSAKSLTARARGTMRAWLEKGLNWESEAWSAPQPRPEGEKEELALNYARKGDVSGLEGMRRRGDLSGVSAIRLARVALGNSRFGVLDWLTDGLDWGEVLLAPLLRMVLFDKKSFGTERRRWLEGTFPESEGAYGEGVERALRDYLLLESFDADVATWIRGRFLTEPPILLPDGPTLDWDPNVEEAPPGAMAAFGREMEVWKDRREWLYSFTREASLDAFKWALADYCASRDELAEDEMTLETMVWALTRDFFDALNYIRMGGAAPAGTTLAAFAEEMRLLAEEEGGEEEGDLRPEEAEEKGETRWRAEKESPAGEEEVNFKLLNWRLFSNLLRLQLVQRTIEFNYDDFAAMICGPAGRGTDDNDCLVAEALWALVSGVDRV